MPGEITKFVKEVAKDLNPVSAFRDMNQEFKKARKEERKFAVDSSFIAKCLIELEKDSKIENFKKKNKERNLKKLELFKNRNAIAEGKFDKARINKMFFDAKTAVNEQAVALNHLLEIINMVEKEIRPFELEGHIDQFTKHVLSIKKVLDDELILLDNLILINHNGNIRDAFKMFLQQMMRERDAYILLENESRVLIEKVTEKVNYIFTNHPKVSDDVKFLRFIFKGLIGLVAFVGVSAIMGNVQIETVFSAINIPPKLIEGIATFGTMLGPDAVRALMNKRKQELISKL